MANKRKELTHEVYQDKVIKCRKCQQAIGEQRLDCQVLVLENGLICFNYICFKHSCGKSQSWLAPTLPDEKKEDAPDISDIIHKSLSVKEQAKKLGYKTLTTAQQSR